MADIRVVNHRARRAAVTQGLIRPSITSRPVTENTAIMNSTSANHCMSRSYGYPRVPFPRACTSGILLYTLRAPDDANGFQ